MQITSVNIGTRRLLQGKSFDGETGIFKNPVTAPVPIHPLGLEGDAVLNEKYHGGPDQAVIHFEMDTPNGTVPVCDWVTVQGGEITAIDSFYDASGLKD